MAKLNDDIYRCKDDELEANGGIFLQACLTKDELLKLRSDRMREEYFEGLIKEFNKLTDEELYNLLVESGLEDCPKEDGKHKIKLKIKSIIGKIRGGNT